jgi:hypothetical protein
MSTSEPEASNRRDAAPASARSADGPLAHRLVDDAAIFPPGNAALPTAVEQHRQHRAAWYGPSVGPLLVRLSDAAELHDLLSDDEQLAVGLVCPPDASPDHVTRAAVHLRRGQRAVVTAVEQPVPDGVDATAVAVARSLGARYWAEVPQTSTLDGSLPGHLDAVAAAGASAKYRTGGVQAQAFPSELQLARFIRACVDRDLPFKLTAGLHHAVRLTAVGTGAHGEDVEQHGLLNVMGAVAAALDGDDEAQLVPLLADRQAARVAAVVERLGDDALRAVRRAFVSFGCCGVTDPLTDLVTLSVLDQGPTPDKETS